MIGQTQGNDAHALIGSSYGYGSGVTFIGQLNHATANNVAIGSSSVTQSIGQSQSNFVNVGGYVNGN